MRGGCEDKGLNCLGRGVVEGIGGKVGLTGMLGMGWTTGVLRYPIQQSLVYILFMYTQLNPSNLESWKISLILPCFLETIWAVPFVRLLGAFGLRVNLALMLFEVSIADQPQIAGSKAASSGKLEKLAQELGFKAEGR